MTAGRAAAESDGICHVCGGTRFADRAVLWPALIDEWGLSAEEARTVDEQQGTHCVDCGSNVRSIAMARALGWHYGFPGPLKAFVDDPVSLPLRVLEINEAGTLHPFLSRMRGHRLASYPVVDMLAMPYEAGAFDLIVHSDTLEHVEDPVAGLRECRRVLADAGALAFTVPALAGRLTRSRAGLPASYHGAPETPDPQMLVHTEFGADVWAMVLGAGYSTCTVVSYRFPAGMAFVARP
jgi:SAM-dependent methyltransferase